MTILDVVALTQDLPEHGLVRGQVGTIVEDLGGDVVEVEFADTNGVPYAMLGVKQKDLMLLTHERVACLGVKAGHLRRKPNCSISFIF